MAAGRIVVAPYFPAEDSNGARYPYAKLWTYEDGTTTLKTTYSDEALTVPNTNPVVANSAGQFPPIWATVSTPVLDSELLSVAIWTNDGQQLASYGAVSPTLDAATAAVVLAEAAADAAAADADAAEEALAEIEDIVANAPDAPSIVNKANRNGDNVTGTNATAFRVAIGADDAANINTLQTGTGMGLRTQIGKNNDRFNLYDVEGVEAKIDANQNITTEFNTALAEALSSGKRLILPAKSLKLSQGITIAGAQIEGQGQGRTTLYVDRATYANNGAPFLYANSPTEGFYLGGVTIDYDDAVFQSATRGHGLYALAVNAADGVSFEDIDFQGYAFTHVYANAVTDFNAARLRLTGKSASKAGTATRSSNVVTVSSTAHGLATGEYVSFVCPTNGSLSFYGPITVTNANTYTAAKVGPNVGVAVAGTTYSRAGTGILINGDSRGVTIDDPRFHGMFEYGLAMTGTDIEAKTPRLMTRSGETTSTQVFFTYMASVTRGRISGGSALNSQAEAFNLTDCERVVIDGVSGQWDAGWSRDYGISVNGDASGGTRFCRVTNFSVKGSYSPGIGLMNNTKDSVAENGKVVDCGMAYYLATSDATSGSLDIGAAETDPNHLGSSNLRNILSDIEVVNTTATTMPYVTIERNGVGNTTTGNEINNIRSDGSYTNRDVLASSSGSSVYDAPRIFRTTTPTVLADVANPTVASASVSYQRVGKRVVGRFQITITTNGTAANYLAIAAPISPKSGELGSLGATKEDTATPLSVKFSGSNFLIQTSGGGYPGGDGTSIAGGFDYEID